ncbi:MAG: SDR family NAD(P)-dependent oxidoreductase [Hydrogenophaga sp.]|jgi:UDP-glucuronate 4-epimerase|uniref:SDR family NAD(P)-dependent oxidoreductase n=1 Tax=Hydrogenophaga sp. TaxID=1904254 RepID=UPI002730E754|nr:SDR family NAD(P)-dependent oxidoreductase [Hydrogenophaga sp.]MDP2407200.1 SDR family NAD(P)-dependent oxidoreductase [Hydrogenophaga sp.]MDZ4175117.1 SDR family NAD(P)-dependent oxidoreductase [Hydrogenophaga sp.]
MSELFVAPGRSILVTGAAGFIGFHLCQRLLDQGFAVEGLDNLNAYYEPTLKQARLQQLLARPGFVFHRLDLADREAMARLFAENRYDAVLHLAAQAGVRHSVDHPMAYLDSNLAGMLTVLEGCRHSGVRHLVYASSSSIYGAARQMPLREDMVTDQPISLYAASKKANELMAYSYSHLYGIPATGLRLFTVYGPWGRPDMAIFKFVRAVLAGQPIDVYNNGQMRRDFTYVDDVVDAVLKVMAVPPVATADAPAHRVLNVGNNGPVSLLDFIGCIEKATGIEAIKHFMPMQQGDVPETWADTTALEKGFGIRPNTDLQLGVQRFVDWYRGYYGDAATA